MVGAMYILSRKLGQSIFIGTEIEVKVTSIQSNRIRLAITCPSHVRIMRAELIQQATESEWSAARRNAS